jgi:predicted ATPase/DNA-binding CsgD family transcriptional regulator/DNA-binding XRE family transcriptional regulator/Tfp pilus assembly protein PilF
MPTDQPLRFGELLRHYRAEAGLTQAALAERAGLSVRGLSDLERGARRLPHPGTMQRLAGALALGQAERAALLAAGRHTGVPSGGRPAGDRPAPALPVPLTSFVGRERELAEVRRLLGSVRLLTLTGTGGVGKTRLALELAHTLADTYPDGVWLVELASLGDQNLVPRAVAGVLGVPEQSRRALLDVLIDALRHRGLLLVLDNCERLVAACAALADSLLRVCPGLVILATSREPLGVAGETTWRVPSLALPDPEAPWSIERLMACEAVQLFLTRAGVVVPVFALTRQNAPAVAEVCRRLDGVPLAIELAAARVRVLAPEQIVARLEDHLRLLTGGGRTAPPRQQTLRATLDWSYDLLTEPERRLFERLSVFAGGWTLEAAEAVCAGDGIEPAAVLDLLTRLVDKSLVIAEPGAGGAVRFRLLETVRQYGLQRLAARGDADATLARHAAFFTGLAEELEPITVGPDWTARLDRLDREHDNLRAALRWLVDRGDVAGAQRLGGALALFWFLRGHRVEGRTWLAELLALPGGPARSATRAKLLFGTGLIALHQGDHAAVRGPVEEALAVWRELGNRVRMAYALYVLGLLGWWRGDREKGSEWFRQGLETARAAGDRTVEAFNLRGLALVALDDGAYAEARERAEEALALASHPRSVSQALTILGDISYREGDWAKARTFLEASVARARELGERILVRVALPSLAHVLIEQADYAQADALLTENLALARDHGDREGVRRGLEGFAHLAAAQGRPASAVRLVGAAAALREAIGAPLSPSERATRERWLASARDVLGEQASALAWAEGRAISLEQAMAHARSDGDDGSPGAGHGSIRADSRPARHEPHGLTPRESEVAALVAEGLSNLQIAERLVISERTVESHVSNILGKLSLGSRARLAAWAVEHQVLTPRPA